MWEIRGGDPNLVGANMAEFAIGSISTMAIRNPRIQIRGLVPYLGSHLTVSWSYVIALATCIAGVHFALFASAIYGSRVVIIKDDSNLSIAQLLRPLVDNLGSSGMLLQGKEISQFLDRDGTSGVVYGPCKIEEPDVYNLGIDGNIVPRKRLYNRRHPDGMYL